MVKKGNLWSNMPEPSVRNGSLDFFESDTLKMYNQGIVVYETLLTKDGSFKF